MRTVPFIVARAFSETTGRTLRSTVGGSGFTPGDPLRLAAGSAGDGATERETPGAESSAPVAGSAVDDSDFLFPGVTISDDAVREFGVAGTDFEGSGGFVSAADDVEEGDRVFAGAEFSGATEELLEPAELGADRLVERRKNRGTNRIARSTAAAAPTSISVFEPEDLGGDGTLRGPAMVAFTCGSEETGIRVRAGFIVVFGETGESGTASGSICGNGWR